MKNKIKHEIINNKNYIYLAWIISILTILPQIITSAQISDSKHVIFLYITLFLLILISKFSKVLFIAAIFYINVTNILIGHIFMHWGYNGKITSQISVFFDSPQHEQMEYIATFIDYRDMLLILYTLFVLTLLYKFMMHFQNTFKVWRRFTLTLFIIIITPLAYYKNPLIKVEPFSLLHEYQEAKEFTEYPKLRIKYLNKLDKTTDKNNTPLYDTIVVIQGESVNKHHMSLYGYDKNTTPFFSSLKKEKKLLSIQCHLSCKPNKTICAYIKYSS